MRSFTSLSLVSVLAALCVLPAGAQQAGAAPPTWKPAYWAETMVAIKTARENGEKQQAENLCAQAIPYVEHQAIQALNDYSSLLDAQQAGSGADMRAKAERLAQAKERAAQSSKAGSSYLGFVPWDELAHYADALNKAHREAESQDIRNLAAAYKYSQEVYVRRSLLMRAGKDPRGEC